MAVDPFFLGRHGSRIGAVLVDKLTYYFDFYNYRPTDFKKGLSK